MPTVTELVLTLLSCLGVAQLLAPKGDRLLALAVSFLLWLTMNVTFVAVGVLAEMNGWFVR